MNMNISEFWLGVYTKKLPNQKLRVFDKDGWMRAECASATASIKKLSREWKEGQTQIRLRKKKKEEKDT